MISFMFINCKNNKERMIFMIQSKQELIQNLLDPLYHHFDLPLLLSQDLIIIDSPQSF